MLLRLIPALALVAVLTGAGFWLGLRSSDVTPPSQTSALRLPSAADLEDEIIDTARASTDADSTAGSAQLSQDSPAAEPPSTASQSPEPLATPAEALRASAEAEHSPGAESPSSRPGQDAARSITSFADLEQTLVTFLQASEGVTGVALYEPSGGLLMGINQDSLFPMASLVKVHLMLAYLDRVAAEGRELTDEESLLLEWMITVSDNDAADALWYAIGEGGVSDFLRAHGLDTLPPIEGEGWGTTLDSPMDIALLFAHLYSGDLLQGDAWQRAFDLLARVDLTQRWGIAAGLPTDEPDMVYMKDGWYPAEDGWWLNSAGIIAPSEGRPAYVLVILAERQPTFDYGVETMETIAALVNGFMRSSNTALIR